MVERPTNQRERRQLRQQTDDTWAQWAANNDTNGAEENARLYRQVQEGRAALYKPNKRTRG